MPAFGDNPFTVLTAIAAPAVLTNASSVLSLGTGNRMARVVDRTRVLTAELSRAEAGTPAHDFLLQQLDRLRTRSQLLMRALRFVYASLGSFAASALVAVIGSGFEAFAMQAAAHAAAAVGLLIGAAGVGALVTGCILMMRETQIAVLTMAEEADFAQSGRA